MKQILTILFLINISLLTAQGLKEKSHNLEIEYLFPIHQNRDIHTISLNALHKIIYSNLQFIEFSVGGTITYAWGNIIQLNDQLNEIESQTNAIGIGPIAQIELPIIKSKSFRFKPYFSTGIILYSNRFPKGGDIYNFMLRIGLSLEYNITPLLKIGIVPKFMHVSNGQGLIPENPSYESLGIALNLSKNI